MLAKRTFKNQITIPKNVISHFEGIEYFDVRVDEERIVLEPVEVKSTKDRLRAIRGKMRKLGITPNDIEEAIHWARRK